MHRTGENPRLVKYSGPFFAKPSAIFIMGPFTDRGIFNDEPAKLTNDYYTRIAVVDVYR